MWKKVESTSLVSSLGLSLSLSSHAKNFVSKNKRGGRGAK
jgi:hypothetical protein